MSFFGLHIPKITWSEAEKALDEAQIIFTPNPEMLLEVHKNSSYLKVLQSATLLLPDGNGLRLVSTLEKYPKFLRALALPFSYPHYLVHKKFYSKDFPELIHGSDFMETIVSWAADNQKSVFFLGGWDKVAEKTASFFQKKHPHLKIAGHSSLNPSEEKTFELINTSKAAVVLVAYGAPKQERWIIEATEKCPHVFHFMGVGGSFDFWSGNIKRAPLIMRKLGLEWLFRLYKEPKKRFKRIWNALVVFPILALFEDEPS